MHVSKKVLLIVAIAASSSLATIAVQYVAHKTDKAHDAVEQYCIDRDGLEGFDECVTKHWFW
jgi:hypothetical protein